MQYQSGMVAARWLKENNYKAPYAMYNTFFHSFEFYANGEPTWLYNMDDLKKFSTVHQPCIIYASNEKVDSLKQAGVQLKPLQQFDYFRISMLTGEFLNPATRSNATIKTSLVRVLP